MPPVVEGYPGSLSGRVAKGASLLLGISFVVRGIRFLATIVLARLLLPEHYGTIAIASVAIGFGEVLTDFRVNSALVRSNDIGPEQLDAAFTLTLLRGVTLGLATVIAAPFAERYFETPALAVVLYWLAIGPVIDGLANPGLVILEKKLDYSTEAWLTVLGSSVTTVLTIAGAFLLRDERALIIGTLAGKLSRTIGSHLVVRRRPRLRTHGMRELLGFGGWLTASGIVSYINMKIDVVAVGAREDSATLGAYSIGQETASATTVQISAPLSRALYPALVESSSDPNRLMGAFLAAQQLIAAVALPLGVGTSLVAVELVRATVGSKWDVAIPVVQYLAPVMAINLVTGGTQTLAMTLGKTQSFFRTQLASFLVRAPLVLAGSYLGGMLGVVYARIASGLLLGLLNAQLAGRLLEMNMFRPYLGAWRSLVSVIGMAFVVWSTGFWLAPPLSSEMSTRLLLARLAILVSAGAASYVALHLTLWRVAGLPQGPEKRVITLLRERMKRRA
jgi:O-antigen/teichoic acid export membrane protein